MRDTANYREYCYLRPHFMQLELERPVWLPIPETMQEVDYLIQSYRPRVTHVIEPLVREYYPALLANEHNEYRKLIELSTKMTLVGHAGTRILGQPFDARRLAIAALYGCCCFLGDSFVDDFGEEITRDYLERLDALLSDGWFSPRNAREELFYVSISRLFAERDVFDPMLRQAIVRLYDAQKRDVELRFRGSTFQTLSRRERLRTLEECARNRGGFTSIVLCSLLVPAIPLSVQRWLFMTGSLFMHIDDHGDCFADLHRHRHTYLNQVSGPEDTLQRIVEETLSGVHAALPTSDGRDIMIAFLYRYFTTRMKKHVMENETRLTSGWNVYE